MFGRFETRAPREAIKGETKSIALRRGAIVLAVLASMVISGICLKAHAAPFVWFWLAWAVMLFGLVFRVRGSWPRALIFNASVGATTLAAGEAYFSFEERENPTHSPEYRVKDPGLGWALAKGVQTRARRQRHGRLLYDVTYTIDADGLRVSPATEKTRQVGTVLFFGCSFTFGDGLQDNETLPYQVGLQSGGRWRTFNFACGNYGPHQMLAALEDGRVARVLDSRPQYAFYVAIPIHVARVAGKIATGKGAPRYRLDTAGTPRLDGHFGDEIRSPGFLEAQVLYRFPEVVPWVDSQFRKSAIYRMVANSDSPTTHGDVRLLMAVVRKSREILEADYPGIEFHVIFWPSHFVEYRALYQEMLDGFRRLNIPVHRVEEILPGYDREVPTRDQTEYLIAPTDGHPNALANRLLAGYVVNKILEPASGAAEAAD